MSARENVIEFCRLERYKTHNKLIYSCNSGCRAVSNTKITPNFVFPIVSTSPQPPSWRTTPCRLSATDYSIYSQFCSTRAPTNPEDGYGFTETSDNHILTPVFVFQLLAPLPNHQAGGPPLCRLSATEYYIYSQFWFYQSPSTP